MVPLQLGSGMLLGDGGGGKALESWFSSALPIGKLAGAVVTLSTQ